MADLYDHLIQPNPADCHKNLHVIAKSFKAYSIHRLNGGSQRATRVQIRNNLGITPGSDIETDLNAIADVIDAKLDADLLPYLEEIEMVFEFVRLGFINKGTAKTWLGI